MAYIDVHNTSGKKIYYLGKTIRIGPNKWKKIRIKLGDKAPSKEIIAKKLKELNLEEYKAYNDDYIDVAKLEVIDDYKEAYNSHIKRIPKTALEKEESDFAIRFTYNSNAIEGNRLTLRDTYFIIHENRIPSGAPAKDYNEAINGKEVLDLLKEYKGKLDTNLIEKINWLLTKNTGISYPGKLRFFNVKIMGTDFIPPDHKEVPKLIDGMAKFYYKEKNKIHPFVLACLIHAMFVEIHPFEDGNGRTGRALMNLVLMRAGYPKFYVPFTLRDKYYKAIDMHNEGRQKEYCNAMFDIVVAQLSTKSL